MKVFSPTISTIWGFFYVSPEREESGLVSPYRFTFSSIFLPGRRMGTVLLFLTMLNFSREGEDKTTSDFIPNLRHLAMLLQQG